MTLWTDEPCDYFPPHAPHLWGGEVENGEEPYVMMSQYIFRCDGMGRYDPDA